MKGLLPVTLISIALISGTARAELSQECILDGRVSYKESVPNVTEVRLTFHNIEHGDQARCHSLTRNPKSRIQFKADLSDNLDKLPNGSKVSYRYIEQDGQVQWELLQNNTAIVLN
tara:strand:+ start:818 stop:1165 length:348 start_codon:yes stop_codon:yes gene_type:complete